MSSIKSNLVIACFSFGLGYVVAQSINHQTTTYAVDEINKPLNTPPDKKILISEVLQDISQSDHTGQLLTENYVIKIQNILKETPEQTIYAYLNKAFPHNDLTPIHDKKKFASRLIDEISNSDMSLSSQDNTGHVTISPNTLISVQSANMEQVYKNQEIFAHLDTLGKVPNDSQVFIRWINQDTGEILLFTPVRINSDSQQNWLSFSPANGWKEGNYAVKYYQMNESLNPIAQTSFTIKQIIE